ncbi:hypothetical protein ABI59_04335 [Acidobacteria bacterium Mor1]|nr:hypothetical protein ABI59_04335 [Acidobacteria bacterium Mor1]
MTGDHVEAAEGYLAGDDDRRIADLNRMFRDPDLAAVWFARGGYGTARLLERVDWRALRRHPKLLIGYSDLTALFAPARKRSGVRCLYGPVVEELADAGAANRRWLDSMLRGDRTELRLRKRDIWVPGKAAGTLVGGNLVVLNHLLGTRFAEDTRDGILFLEEIGEETYRIDRMLTQWRQSGGLRGLRGVVLGAFVGHQRTKPFPPDRDLRQVLLEAFEPLGIPVVAGVRAGHVRGKRAMPLGGRVTIDAPARRLRFDPAAP